ncbi:MAG: molybdopterin molybdotransferase MoeA [Candidatus Aminicenantes bacterium]|jgi:molybdopterin molybdotransferase|nr:molybdopterin molybdotransferase MoeA [Candidatus Aminicenantes bacterium]
MSDAINMDLYNVINIIENYNIKLTSEFLPIEDTSGLVSASEIKAPFDFPEKKRSRMDGFAFDIKIADFKKKLKVVAHLNANETYDHKLQADECIRCSTGSNLSKNQNAVVPIEFCNESNGYIEIDGTFRMKNRYIEEAGSIFKKNQVIINNGSIIDHRDVEKLALCRINSINVYKKPSIGIISTGSEITEQYIIKDSIINSNYHMLASFLSSKKIPFTYLGIVKDNYNEILNKINEATEHYDIVVTFGGTAFGQKDLIKKIIMESKGEIMAENLNASPGRTFKFAEINKKPVFILPGNPASASICIELFLNLFINKNYYNVKTTLINGTANFSLNKKQGFHKLIPGFISFDKDGIIFYDRINTQNYHRHFNGIAIIDAEIQSVKVGDSVDLYLIN